MSRRQSGVLVRLSDDKLEDASGVGRQEDDCRELAGRLDWDVAEVYVENDTSAFKRKMVRLPDGTTALRVIRPAFRRMLEDLASGGIDAVIGYDLDRVARDPRDLEDLIDVVETHSIPTRAVTGSLDLSTDAGVTMARVMVAVANKSSRDTARRVIRKQLEMAQAGKFKGGGKRPFGYEADGITLREAEAQVVRTIATRTLAGDSLSALTRYLDETGFKPSLGGDNWNRRSVHSLLSTPRIAGFRTYRGEVIAKAEWPAIIDEDTWEQVVAVLKSRAGGRTNKLRWWLTGVLRCGLCGNGLSGATNKYGGRYWCSTLRDGCGRIGTNLPKTELACETMLLTYLSRSDVLSTLRDTVSKSGADKARDEAKADEAQLAELAKMWAEKELTRDEYRVARTTIVDRLSKWQGVIRASLPASVRELTGGDIDTVWARFGPVERREVAQTVWPNGITVAPHTGSRFKGWDATRLTPVDWVTADENGATS